MKQENNLRNVFPDKSCNSCEHMEWDELSEDEENNVWCPINKCIVRVYCLCDRYKGIWDYI